jgi:hypothetical protein
MQADATTVIEPGRDPVEARPAVPARFPTPT